MMFSMIPFLFALQLAFWFAITLRARSALAFRAALAVAVTLCIWGAASARLALNDVYDKDWFLSLLPGLWLPAVPIALTFALLFVAPMRRGLVLIAEATPDHWFVAVQSLRIAALGTLIKTLQGDFPLEVELAIGITDLAFGASAVWLFFKTRQNLISADALVLWHIVGVLIIILPGEIALQSGLPGPMRVFDQYPTSEVMLDWPMVLAPSLVVPTFLLLNIFAAVAAYRRRLTRSTERIPAHV